MHPPTLHTLIESIYDAALDPDQWYEVTRLLRQTFNSPAAGLFIQNRWTQDFQQAPMLGIETKYLNSYAAYYSRTNPWAQAGLFRPDLTITESTVDRHYNRPGAYHESEFYNDWVKPQGFYYSMGGTVRTFGPETVNFTFFRPYDAGPYSRRELHLFETVKPHIGRAVEIGGRLESLNAQLQSHWHLLDQLPMGIALLDEESRLVHANGKAEKYLSEGTLLKAKNGFLESPRKEANASLQKAIRAASAFLRGEATSHPFSLTLAPPDDSQRLAVTAVPIPGESSPLGGTRPAIYVFLCRPEQNQSLDHQGLQSHFDLTPAEARLAKQLARGLELKEAAHKIGVSYETARSYLKSILAKTGTHRQHELLTLLLSDWTLNLKRN